MTLREPSDRRQLPVRLDQIRLEARLAAAQAAAEGGDGDLLLAVALQPSSLTYYVAESARPLLERLAA